MAHMLSVLCDAHGQRCGVVPGRVPAPRVNEIPTATSVRVGLGEEYLKLIPSTDDPDVSYLGVDRPYRGGVKRWHLLPHYGPKYVIPGRRLTIGPKDLDHPCRKFRRILLPSGGFYLQTYTVESLYVGIAADGYLALTKERYPWFLTSG